MSGSAPTLKLTADNMNPDPGDNVGINLVITDVDDTTEMLETSGTDALHREVTQDTTIVRDDVPQSILWTVGGNRIPNLDGLSSFQWPITAADAGKTLVVAVDVIDAQGNPASASIGLQVTAPPPPTPKLALGCAIGALPDGSRSRTARWTDFVAATPGARKVMRVYLDEVQTEALIKKYEANPNRTDLWPIAGDIWTPGTPHPHDIAVSLKVNHAQMAAGRYVGLIKALCRQYPGPGIFRVTCWHEPYDNIFKSHQFTLAEYKATIAKLITIVAEFGPKVQPWIVLTGEQFDKVNVGTDKDPDTFFVPGVYGVAGDRYQVPSCKHDGSLWWSQPFMHDRYTAWCRGKGVAAGLWEYASAVDFADPQHRSQDLIAAVGYAEFSGIEVFLWFDNVGPKGDWYVDADVRRARYYPPEGVAQEPIVGTIKPDPITANTWHQLVIAAG